MDSSVPALTGIASFVKPPQVSPLLLADRLITMAQDADRAGFSMAATHLMTAMYAVLEPQALAQH